MVDDINEKITQGSGRIVAYHCLHREQEIEGVGDLLQSTFIVEMPAD